MTIIAAVQDDLLTLTAALLELKKELDDREENFNTRDDYGVGDCTHICPQPYTIVLSP